MKTVKYTATLMVAAIIAVVLAGCKKTDEHENNGEELIVDCMLPDNVEAIDLGLPSGLKWANMNVGATKPEEFGALFAWGETTQKSDYSWGRYEWCIGGNQMQLTKYCTKSRYGYNEFTDDKTTLDLEDDAARMNWGGSWRMPTKAEQDELRNTDNCTWEWKTNYNGTNANGYLVTSKKNSNSIFLPASGYWSSSLYDYYPNFAYYLIAISGQVNWTNSHRCNGKSVRPVCN